MKLDSLNLTKLSRELDELVSFLVLITRITPNDNQSSRRKHRSEVRAEGEFIEYPS
jgi:hypothetical protein